MDKRKPGRPVEGDGKRHFVGLRIEGELLAWIDAVAQLQSLTRSAAIRQLLQAAMLRQDPPQNRPERGLEATKIRR